MGTKVHLDSFFNHTMGDLNEDLNGNNWRKCYGENGIADGRRYYDGFIDKTPTYADRNCERDELKLRMLEHEALFKAQLQELHRLYKIQRELMEDAKKKKGLQGVQVPTKRQQPSSSSSTLRGGHTLTNAGQARFPYMNGPGSKVFEGLDSRPSKVRKKLFDLQRPAEEYVDADEEEEEERVDLNVPFRMEGETVASWAHSSSDFTQACWSNGSGSKTREPQARSPFLGFSYLSCNGNGNISQRRAIDIDLNEVGEEDKTAEDNVSALPWLKHNTMEKILGIPIFGTVGRTNEPAASNMEHTKRVLDINLECEPDDEPALEEEKNLGGFGSTRDVMIDLNSCVVESDGPSWRLSEAPPRANRILEIDLEAPPVQESEDDTAAELYQEIVARDSLSLLQSKVGKTEVFHDEDHRKAAESIFAISSFCPDVEEERLPSCENSLLWFADVLSSFGEEDGLTEKQLLSEEIDDFEATTLQLQEMREHKDYTAWPVREPEEAGPGNSLITRPRRGQSRRGRQRKDFQRDILPSLSTLSRQEVTEDLQAFGGLMRAMGHHWNSGPTRRNGGRARGRRRAVTETLSNDVQNLAFEDPLVHKLGTVLEDRSITGWGKTTRRPRRQRCAASGNSNPTTAVLT